MFHSITLRDYKVRAISTGKNLFLFETGSQTSAGVVPFGQEIVQQQYHKSLLNHP